MPTQPLTKPVRRSLSREAIASTALELADAEGVDSLSMRRLAERLGVGTMTLYGYFRSKEELLEAVVDVATPPIRVRAGATSWKDQLRDLMRGVHGALAEHPVGVELRLRKPLVSPGAMRITEAAMGILSGAGFGTEDAARCYRTLFLYVFGFIAFGSPRAPDEVKRHARGVIASLPAEEYRQVTAAGAELVETLAGEEQFEFGLGVLLDGLEARASA